MGPTYPGRRALTRPATAPAFRASPEDPGDLTSPPPHFSRLPGARGVRGLRFFLDRSVIHDVLRPCVTAALACARRVVPSDTSGGVAMRVLAFVLALSAAWGHPSASAAATSRLPRIRHVFIIILENKGFDETFGPDSPAVYLSQTLTQQGQLLRQYYATGHVSLDNYVSLVSGQAPNPETQSDCQIDTDFVGAPGLDADGQPVGQGCVYPSFVPTIADQLAAAHRTWKGYMQDMGNSPTAPATCRHPALNSQDDTQMARQGDQYAARHNPFVYFHSIIDSPSCDRNVVPLTEFPADLMRVS